MLLPNSDVTDVISDRISVLIPAFRVSKRGLNSSIVKDWPDLTKMHAQMITNILILSMIAIFFFKLAEVYLSFVKQ